MGGSVCLEVLCLHEPSVEVEVKISGGENTLSKESSNLLEVILSQGTINDPLTRFSV